jgi:hypothetical protein
MGLSYADAVRLMGDPDSRTVAALDRLTGGLLLAAAAAGGGGFALSLFNAQGELVKLSNSLVASLEDHLRGLGRYSRSERLTAALSVVTVTAFFDTVKNVELPFDYRELELSKSEQVALVERNAPDSDRLRALAAGLLRAEIPMPTPQRPYESVIEDLRTFYKNLSGELLRFMSGLAVYSRLSQAERQQFAHKLREDVPGRAITRYEGMFRELAARFPEVALWANQRDHQATRAEVRQLAGGLEGLEILLASIAEGRVPDERRLSLSRAYRAVLERPIITAGPVPERLHLPPLGKLYVNPDFRAAEVGQSEPFAEESWWHQWTVRDDLEQFLLGHLTAPQAVRAPLLVLGQPGSGKSALTQVLAARLPPKDFLVVRVVLREVAADADLQAQIEHAIRGATGENLPWPDLSRSAGDALPVVLLDGFDEMLQATGVSQTDYLLTVAAFQAREADQGRPVAVLVTSRTAVADRAQPVPGMVVVRLEAFHDAQVIQWLGVWNDANAAALSAGGLRPLAAETVLAHPDLASQPLLLLMLALYDADGNRLQRAEALLGKAELYERLLNSFARREVSKTGAGLPPAQVNDAVERELLQLSVVAFAMFCRGRQWVTEAELNADLPALLGYTDKPTSVVSLRARLSVSELQVGRFFFVHEAQATRDNTRLRTYEFMHATFSEYLIARLVTRELGDLADAAQFAVNRSRAVSPDDAFLYALLSFSPLTTRGTIVSFLAERLQSLEETRRSWVRRVLRELFREAFGPRHDTRYGDYAPLSLPVPSRYAAYSANLVVLAVFASGEVAGRALFPAADDPVSDWRRLALLWRSQLQEEGWDGLTRTITVLRVWSGDQRDIRLVRSKPEQQLPHSDPFWTYNFWPRYDRRRHRRQGHFNWVYIDADQLIFQAQFLCDAREDALTHALEPFGDNNLGPAVTAFHSYEPDKDRAVSAANALITLWLKTGQDSTPDELAAAYDICLRIAIHGFAPFEVSARERFRVLVLRQLAADQERLPLAWLESTVTKIQEAGGAEPFEGSGLLEIANHIIPGLMAIRPKNASQ